EISWPRYCYIDSAQSGTSSRNRLTTCSNPKSLLSGERFLGSCVRIVHALFEHCMTSNYFKFAQQPVTQNDIASATAIMLIVAKAFQEAYASAVLVFLAVASWSSNT